MEEIDTKEKILQGAEDLFVKYGIRSISMDDIARHLSVSKKTLYQHFVDKDELVTMVVQSHLNDQKKIYDQIEEQSENSIDELHRIGDCLRRHAQESNPTLLFDIQKFHPKAWSVWVEYKNNVIRCSILRNIEQGVKDGHFRADIKPEILSSYRLASIEVIHSDVIFPKDKFNLAEVHSQIFEHFVYGLCTEKGRKLYQKYKENNHKLLSNETVL
jgi:AcrR family transcriptional regulator